MAGERNRARGARDGDAAREDGAQADRPDDASPLFRAEALAVQRAGWLGTVLLAQPLSQRVFVVFALVAMLGVAALAAFGEFTRKARVNGWLVPEQGLVRVFAPHSAVVSELRVREGAKVRRGDPLMVLSTERQSAARGDTQAEVSRLLARRRESLQTERRQQQQLFEQQRASLRQRLDTMTEEMRQLSQEIAFQVSRVELSDAALERQRSLQRLGYASMQQVQAQEEQVLEQRARVRALERQRTERQRESSGLKAELAELPLRAQAQFAALERSVATLEQELAETESRRTIIVPAPQSGTVSALQVEAGSTVNPATPLMSIVPEQARLEAQLFTPSRSIGFVHEGQRVLLRYQAYPYQKFGHHEGTVTSVSRTAVSPSELPSQLAGLSALVGSNEPVYRITVALERQTVTAYGREQSLQAGMQLEADIALERRLLAEWMLEPLYTLTGRL